MMRKMSIAKIIILIVIVIVIAGFGIFCCVNRNRLYAEKIVRCAQYIDKNDYDRLSKKADSFDSSAVKHNSGTGWRYIEFYADREKEYSIRVKYGLSRNEIYGIESYDGFAEVTITPEVRDAHEAVQKLCGELKSVLNGRYIQAPVTGWWDVEEHRSVYISYDKYSGVCRLKYNNSDIRY